MSDRIQSTSHGDAPMSAAHRADASVDPYLGAEPADEFIARSVTIDRPRQELYEFWREFRNLPNLMPDIIAVQVLDRERLHWRVRGPTGSEREWDSVLVADEPGQRIAWRSAEGADHRMSGHIEFRDAPAGRGTEVTLTLSQAEPGLISKALGKLSQHDPRIQARRALRRFKQLMETGELATTQPPAAAPRG